MKLDEDLNTNEPLKFAAHRLCPWPMSIILSIVLYRNVLKTGGLMLNKSTNSRIRNVMTKPKFMRNIHCLTTNKTRKFLARIGSL